ncbi:MAG: GAF domain-containing protein [Desulfobacteraceae bacterium]
MSPDVRITIELFKGITRAVARSLDIETVAHTLAQYLVGALAIKACAVFTLEMGSNQLLRLASFGLSPSYQSKGRVFGDKSLATNLKGEVVVVPDIRESDLLQYPEQAIKEGIGAIVSVPIVFSGRVTGALRLYHSQVWNPSESDLDSLAVLAEVIGLAMAYTNLSHSCADICTVLSSAELPKT